MRAGPEVASVKVHLVNRHARLLYDDDMALDVDGVRFATLLESARPLLDALTTESEHALRAFTFDRRARVIRAIYDRPDPPPMVEARRLDGPRYSEIEPHAGALLCFCRSQAGSRKPAR